MKFSASAFKLGMYETCPKQYSFVYVEGLKEQYDTPKPYLTIGAHVHNALKDLYERVTPDDRSVERLEQLLRTRWRENRRGFASIDDERMWGMKALQMMRLYARKTDLKRNPLLLEDFHKAEISPTVQLIGRVDRVDELSDGSLHVIDYKTGKPDEEPSFFPLQLYAYLIQSKTGRPVSRASFYFLQSGQLVSTTPDEDSMQEAIADVKRRVTMIQDDQAFAPRLNPHCRSCDFREICPIRAKVQEYLEQQT